MTTKPLEFFREWTDEDGEEWAAIHPLYQATAEYYLLKDDRLDRRLKRLSRLLEEIRDGERRPLPGMLDRMLEIDREQQANGCPDENIAGLVELLRGSYERGRDDG